MYLNFPSFLFLSFFPMPNGKGNTNDFYFSPLSFLWLWLQFGLKQLLGIRNKRHIAFDLRDPRLKFSSFPFCVNLYTTLTVNALEREAMQAFRRWLDRCHNPAESLLIAFSVP